MAVAYGGLLEWNHNIVNNFIISGTFEAVVISLALGYRIKLIQKNREIETTKKDHYFDQMMKVFYPHQLHMIQDGRSLEETMPTAPGEACVISFDIIGSSKIQHVRAKEFFRNVFRQCYEEMMNGYNENDFQATAFRIKELGDGFLCSVGYPFRAKSENPANDAVKLALRFQAILATESVILQQSEPVTCGIGISLDTIVGFYPEFGAKEYDLYGRAIILATRYEAMRKTLFAEESAQRSIVILQEKVFASLDPILRTEFSMVDLKAQGLTVRDDPAATRLYVKFIENQDGILNPPITPFVRPLNRKAL
jgi:class 3 adenylate cyclase